MEKRASRISSREKGWMREAAWDGVSEVDWTREERLRSSLAGRGVPRRFLKNPWRMLAKPRTLGSVWIQIQINLEGKDDG
jgi:hypothetical protein